MHKLYISAIIVVVGLFFALTFKAVLGDPSYAEIMTSLKEPGKAFETSQERARYGLVKSLIIDKTLYLDKYAAESLPDIAHKDGHYFSVFQPGLSVLAVPFFKIGQIVNNPVIATFALPALFTIFSALFIFFFALKLNQKPFSAFIAAIIYCLCTIAWSYSITLYAHTASAFCLIAAFYFAYRSRNSSGFRFFLVWFFYGLAALIDYPNLIIGLPILIYFFRENFYLKKIKIKNNFYTILNARLTFFYSAIPFVALLGLLFFYNAETLGNWFEIAHNYRVTELIKNLPSYHYSITKVFDFQNIENGLFTLLISPNRGLLVYSPIAILAFWGFIRLFQRRPYFAKYIGLTFLANLLVYALFYDPWGGWAYGPRYLIVTLPLIAILVAESYESFKEKTFFVLIFILMFFSSFSISLLGALTTNLIPPSAETGKQESFLFALDFLRRSGSESLVLNWINKLHYLSPENYFLLLILLFMTIFLPLFLYQIFLNIIRTVLSYRKYYPSFLKRRMNAIAEN